MKAMNLLLTLSILMGQTATYAANEEVTTQTLELRRTRAEYAVQRLHTLKIQEAALSDYERDPYLATEVRVGTSAVIAMGAGYGAGAMLTITNPRASLKRVFQSIVAGLAAGGVAGYHLLPENKIYAEMRQRLPDMSAEQRAALHEEIVQKIGAVNAEISAINAEDEADGLD